MNNPALSSLEKQRLQNMSIKSKFTSSTNSDSNPTQNINNISLCSSTAAPQYAEIYAPTSSIHQQMANPYASTGLFINQLSENNNNSGNIKYSSYTIKLLNDNKTIAVANQNGDLTSIEHLTNSVAHNAMPLSEQKKLLKYLQATQSQTNTPRVQVREERFFCGGRG